METRKEKIADVVKTSYVEEYKDLQDTWRDIERKAQNTVALAGIFLGGILAFVRNLAATPFNLERFLLIATIILLSVSLFHCILVLKARMIAWPLRGVYVEKLVTDLLKLTSEEFDEKRYTAFVGDQTKTWKQVNNDIYKANLDKARHLWIAQIFIILSLCLVSITAIINILGVKL